MADGSNTTNGNGGREIASPILTKPFSMDDLHTLHGRLLEMHAVAQVLQAAATGDADMVDSGIYGTAALLERQVNEAMALTGL